MRAIEDTLIESVNAGTPEATNESAVPYVAVERETGRDDVYHGFFAIRLDAVVDPAVRKDARRETELMEQLKFVECLVAMEIDRSVQLRLFARPDAGSGMRGRIDVVLVFHAVADSEERAQGAAADLWNNVRTHLSSLAERYEFSPVTAGADLLTLLRPFECHGIAEIGRRERVVSLNGREGLYLVCPFLPTSRNLSRVCASLLAQQHPVVFCVTIRPTRLSPTERQYFDGPMVRRSLVQHPGVLSLPDPQFEGQRPSAQGARPDASSLALQMIHVASEGEIPSALLSIIGSEVSHPGVAAELSKDLLDRPYSGGFVWQQAVGAEKGQATRSMLYQICEPWMDSCSPEGLERIRYLVDPHQACAAFRIPFADQGDAIPGIRLEPKVPFRGSPPSRDGALIGVSRYGMVSIEVAWTRT